MCKISIGNIRYLYGLSKDAARQMAFDLKAEIDTTSFYKEYVGNICSETGINDCIKTIEIMYYSLKNPVACGPFTWYYVKSDELYIALMHALINSNNFDEYRIINNCNNFDEFKYKLQIYLQTQFNIKDLYKQNELSKLIQLSIIDNSIVELNKAISYCKKKGYQNPSRQHFESHPNLSITWDDFQGAFPRRGSFPEEAKRNATDDACNKVINDILRSNIPRINREYFLNKVISFMKAEAKESLYQKAAALKCFTNDKRLEGLKKRGRPPKNLQTMTSAP